MPALRVVVALLLASSLLACGGGAPPRPETVRLGAAGASCGVRAEDALRLVNAARASGRRCGARAMGPAAPLHWDSRLYQAAAAHSSDMARGNYFEHRSPAGRSVRDRVAAARYPVRSVGENIAGGDRNVAEAMQSWLASAPHCENLMDPGFSDVAVACVEQPGTEYGTYWTMVLGRPR